MLHVRQIATLDARFVRRGDGDGEAVDEVVVVVVVVEVPVGGRVCV